MEIHRDENRRTDQLLQNTKENGFNNDVPLLCEEMNRKVRAIKTMKARSGITGIALLFL
jgi:hypothetical protein